jgi:NAD(P)-dependent dehydrogenase (short-subunit alcohol dehydrogenase family)
MQPIKGEVAFVTGAALGWGRAIVDGYARAGMRLAIIDVLGDQINTVAEELRALGAPDVLPITADLSDQSETHRAAETALAHFGAPRVLVHNAAVLREVSMRDVRYDNWQRELNIILQAAFILSKAVWEPMIAAGGGSIVYISSGSGIKGFVKETAYCPGKHGQEGLMKVLSMEGAEFNIAVNTITPGTAINTPMSASHYTDDLRQRWIDPNLLTPAFIYLAQVEAGDVTGQRLDAWQLSQAVRANG